jgi:hypothetical protein
MPATKFKEFLDKNNVRYLSIRHLPAYTAQETAALAQIPGRELAETVPYDDRGVLRYSPSIARTSRDVFRDGGVLGGLARGDRAATKVVIPHRTEINAESQEIG